MCPKSVLIYPISVQVAMGSASTPAIALALGGGREYGSLHGDPALAARMGVQEAVREYCLHLRRSRRGGADGVGGDRNRRIVVPIIRRVCPLHPKSVDLEIGMYAAACEKASGDGAGRGGRGRRGGGGGTRWQEGRELLRVALFEWCASLSLSLSLSCAPILPSCVCLLCNLHVPYMCLIRAFYVPYMCHICA